MTDFLVMADYADGQRTLTAGSVISDAAFDVPALQAAGCALIATTAPILAVLPAYLAARGAAPALPDPADLTALLLAAGAIGGGGGGGVASVTASAPLASSGGANPNITITAATALARGTMSAADKAKLDAISAIVTDVLATAPIASSGGATPTISIAAATGAVPGSMSAADKTKLDGITAGAAVASVGATAPVTSTGGTTPTIALAAGTSTNDLLTWNGSAWVSAELPGRSRGFRSTSLADHYAAGSAGLVPGASNFIAIVGWVPQANRNGAKIETLAECRSGATGWAIRYEYGLLTVVAFDGAGGAVSATVPTPTNYAPGQERGKLHMIGLRAYQNGGVLTVESWLGPERFVTTVGAAAGMTPGAAATFQLANAVTFGDESAVNGTITGFAYFDSTVTDAQMRTIMGDALQRGRIDPAALAWDAIYQGTDVQTAGATWSGTPAALNRAGAPTGVAATYFPPV